MTYSLLEKFFRKSAPQYISFSSELPSQIFHTLKTIEITSDTVILLNGDVWRYANIEHGIFNHNALQGKTVILQTLGYTNTKHNDLHYHISYPYSYFGRVKNIDTPPLAANLKYGFSCLNNKTSIDRFILGHNLYTNNLLDDIIFSQNLTDSAYSLTRIERDLNILNLPNFYEYKKLLPISYHEDTTNGAKITLDHTINHPAFKDAYCNIAVETECEEYPYSRNINLPIITEKSYKPFRARQIPLLVGARGHYAYLKDLGFEMMEDFLPKGYDDMPFLKKVDAVVSTVAKGKEYAKDFYFNHLPEIQHNHELVNSTKVEELVLKRIHNLLTTT